MAINAEKYWDEVASAVSPDGVKIKDNWWKRRALIKRLLAYDIEGANVLEIGAGAGVTASLLSSIYGYYFNYIATDISGKFCEIVKKTMRLKAVQASPLGLPFKDKSYDCLFAFDVLEHIPFHERDALYAELGRVLKDEAFIFINNPLTESKHDPDYDFGFLDSDIAKMAESIGARIYELNTYKGKGEYYYQFVVLKRGGN